MQAKALKIIYGWNLSYETILNLTGQETLEERRKRNFDKFAIKSQKNRRYESWFPKSRDTGHDTRNIVPYQEEFARTERFRNSPVFAMRKRLNEIEGTTNQT